MWLVRWRIQLFHACLTVLFLGACIRQNDVPVASKSASPSATADDTYEQAQYTADCVAKLGGWPWEVDGGYFVNLNCYDSNTIEIRHTSHKDPDSDVATAVKSESDLEGATNGCDYPFLIGFGTNLPSGNKTSCTPYSRIGRKANGGGSEFSWICRTNYFRPAGSAVFDDLGLIGHNPATGDTCFWAIPINGRAPFADAGTDLTITGRQIPVPGTPQDVNFRPGRPFWKTFSEISNGRCLYCHDSDAFIHSPAVHNQLSADGTGFAGIVPSKPKGPYHAVSAAKLNAKASAGNKTWNNAKVITAPAAEPCTECHRIADRETCHVFVPDSVNSTRATTPDKYYQKWYPYSKWMPYHDPRKLRQKYPKKKDWDDAFSAAVKQIADCCVASPAADCKMTAIALKSPSRGCCRDPETTVAFYTDAESCPSSYVFGIDDCPDAPSKVCCAYADAEYPDAVFFDAFYEDYCRDDLLGAPTDEAACVVNNEQICCQTSDEKGNVFFDYKTRQDCLHRLAGSETADADCSEARTACCLTDEDHFQISTRDCYDSGGAPDLTHPNACDADFESVCCRGVDDDQYYQTYRSLCQQPGASVVDLDAGTCSTEIFTPEQPSHPSCLPSGSLCGQAFNPENTPCCSGACPSGTYAECPPSMSDGGCDM